MSRFSSVVRVLLLSCVVLAAPGCAAIFKGAQEKVRFSSDPNGVDVVVDGVPIGKTPLEQWLNSREQHNIELRRKGFESYHASLSSSVGGGWVFLDLLLLPSLIPIIVDAASGSWFHLSSTKVYASLREEERLEPEVAEVPRERVTHGRARVIRH